MIEFFEKELGRQGHMREWENRGGAHYYWGWDGSEVAGNPNKDSDNNQTYHDSFASYLSSCSQVLEKGVPLSFYLSIPNEAVGLAVIARFQEFGIKNIIEDYTWAPKFLNICFNHEDNPNEFFKTNSTYDLPKITLDEFFTWTPPPVIKEKKIEFGDDGYVAVVTDKVVIWDDEGDEVLTISKEQMEQIKAAMESGPNLPEKFYIKTPTQELWDIAVKQLKALGWSQSYFGMSWNEERENSCLHFSSANSFNRSVETYCAGRGYTVLDIADLFIQKTTNIQLGSYTATVTKDGLRAGCQKASKAQVLEILAALKD